MSSMVPNVAAAILHIAPQVNKLIAEAREGDEQSSKKALGDTIVAMLIANGLAYEEVIRNGAVGVHDANRFGAGLLPADVIILHAEIIRDGWSWHEVLGRARAFEVAPGAKGHAQLGANLSLWQASGGMLAPVIREDIRILSVGCSHTVAGLRCGAASTLVPQDVADKVTGMPLERVTTNQRWSMSKIVDVCPSIKEAYEKGMKWVVVRHEVEAACPDLPSFLQEVGNVGHSTRKKNTMIQTLLQIHTRLVQNTKMLGKPNVIGISRQLATTRPELDGHVPDMVAFVQMWAGGDNPIYLNELEAWSKQLHSRREITTKMLREFSRVQLSRFPEYIVACIKAGLAAPDSFCDGCECKLFNSSDLTQMVTMPHSGYVAAATTIMRDAREWLDKVGGIDANVTTKAIGDLDVRLVMHIHCKKVKTRRSFKSLVEIAQCFVSETIAIVPGAAEIASPWALEEEHLR